MTLTTTVDRLYSNGFPLGPKPDQSCKRCGHLWGNHLLVAENDPTLGGHWECPFSGCTCTGTWDLPPDAREAAQEYRRKKNT